MRWARAIYAGLALFTIAVGLLVHRRGQGLGPLVQDVLSDLLWATMIWWWVAALAPKTSRWWRGAVALAFCYAVEFSQLYHTPTLDALRGTRMGHLVLGSGFDPRDLAAYAAGVGTALLLEASAAAWRRRQHRSI